MKKVLSFILILSLLLTFAFPVAKAGTIATKIDYITAGEFVTSLLLGAKVKPDGIADYWGKAVKMGLIPGEVKKDKPLTRAQASYIVWKLINSVPELRDKNIPVKTVVLSPVDYTFWTGGDPTHNFRGAYVAWGPGDGYDFPETQFNSKYAVMAYDLVVIDKYYKDGTIKTVHVWNRLKDYFLPLDWWKVLQRFMRENPDKVKFDLPQERLKAQVWVLGHHSLLGGSPTITDKNFVSTVQNRELYKLYYEPKRNDKLAYWSGCYTFFTYKFDFPPDGIWFTKPRYFQIFLNYLEFGKYKSTNIDDWQWTAELNPVTNEALNRWLMKLPRKFPLDWTRFKYICSDFNRIPALYQEAVLRLADLGIIQPEANVDVNVFKKKFKTIRNYVTWQLNLPPKMDMPDIRFNAGKLLTRAEAVDMIARVFDESKRVVFDELTFENDTIDDYGWNHYTSGTRWAVDVLYFHVGKTITYRIDELWQLLYLVKYELTQKRNITNLYDSLYKRFMPVQILFRFGYGSIGTPSRWISLYDGTI
ncbi:hypothetical protein Calow_0139 [Caldicellulosiruptor owensensis OL]|uniref:SLH domain-containing protein n=1 Tax=Caldicellulosiruptor owensensis (strain ATCC 700167 / DSM 13100 / OL) TaxID=632518 RepID=E4Q2B9_CALOW|nr:hypothetical protein [Caldicellulosiruptor owensensis]ADQ03747.1 hypothetical protein Calow_0139 [Caldicellulosiruptor owensensis OL]